ncbi:site-specific DNA-methyltransferase, partial [Parasphingopyxis lamellibrachiae]
MRPLGAIRINPKNPRTHNAQQIRQISRSITRFGFVNPIIINDDGLIVAGAGRYLAAEALGLEEVPTLKVAFVTEADRRAFALADNRVAELSTWNENLLAAEFEFLFEAEFDDIEITGFDAIEIDDIMLGDEQVSDDDEPPVELPEADAQAVSRTGDLWQIGDHRLLCGDALDPDSYDRLLEGERAQLVFADPPYNVRISGISGSGQIKHREFAHASGEMTKPEFTAFLRMVFRHLVNHSANGSIHFHCMDWRHLREITDAADGVYTELKNLIVWAKSNGGQGSFYRSAHEMIFAFKSGRAQHINNFGLGEKGRYRTNVWRYPGANTFRKGRMDDLRSHPTVKPLRMVADAIRDCSKQRGLILDPFSGSGTTLVAAARTGRRG